MAEELTQRWFEYRVRIPALEGRFQYGHWGDDRDGAERNAARLRESGLDAAVEQREMMMISGPGGAAVPAVPAASSTPEGEER